MEESIKIAIIQPSSPPEKEAFEKGLSILRKEGFFVRNFVDFREDPPSHKAILLFEIMASGLFTHLWAARGGAGAIKLLPYFDELFKASSLNPPLPQLIGFSDITTLHVYFYKKFGKRGLHAPMIVNLATLKANSLKRTLEFIQGRPTSYKLKGKPFRVGESQGVLLGGNLLTLSSLCGTPYFFEEKELILFIEETNEPLYRVERAFLQILFSLPKGSLKGLILGNMGKVNSYEFLKRISEFLPEEIPIGYAFPFGHTANNNPLLIGSKVKMQVTEKRAELLFIDILRP
ncbi:MAG: LD-carboxypeptidase [Caldimicrobium sp.]|jgi:muramoyltetrapeptide carboxypeptidase